MEASQATSANPFLDFTKEQLIVKVVHEVARYNMTDTQVKLSLLQDLIIALLPNVVVGNNIYRELMSVRCHTSSEDVVQWVDKMARVYLKDPHVKCLLAGFTDEQMSMPY